MKKLKKVLAIVICAAVVFSLVGCSDENENGGSNLIISSPSAKPTEAPTAKSTDEATEAPTGEVPSPTAEPTEDEIVEPTEGSTAESTEGSTAEPTENSTAKPTNKPTAKPTTKPTNQSTSKVDISIASLPDSFIWTEAGYSSAVLRIEEHTGVYIGNYDLSKVTKIVVYYGADANADISKDKLYLNDAEYNRLSSNTLERSNGKGWVNGVRGIELTVNSSYSGDLYLTKDEPGNQIAISAIEIYGSGISASTPAPTQIPQGNNSEIVNKILYEAQVVTEFTKKNGFKYGNASINPALNWKDLSVSKAINPNEKLTACDRLVCWVLYRAGFTNQQRYMEGADLHALFNECKFQRLTNVSTLQAGDIVFIDTNGDRQDDHVFIVASGNLGGNVYLRYDHGSDERIQCKKGTEVTPGKQPFKEGISGFLYAYRPNGNHMPNTAAYNSLLVTPSQTAATPSTTAKTIQSAASMTSNNGVDSSAPNYKYKPGNGYKQFEFHLDVKVSSRKEPHWNSCYVGARLPSSAQTPTTYGGVWLGFSPGKQAYVYAGINTIPNVNNWEQVPLAVIELPESMTTSHKIIVTDDGEVVRYYMVRSNGTKALICSIVFNDEIDMMAVYGSKDVRFDPSTRAIDSFINLAGDRLIYWGHAEVNSDNSGYFKVWSHFTTSEAKNIEIKGVQ